MKYSLVNMSGLRPEGWLRAQLLIQARGLSGNLDRIWPDVRDSAWIGGTKEGWERVPYWLDGFVPLAWLLGDEDMKSRAERYIAAILDRQRPDGWICPCADEDRASYDMWAHFLICKVLALYCEFTGSERAEDGLYRAMKCLWDELSSGRIVLKEWGRSRWFEALIPIRYLVERRGGDWLVPLARELRRQGLDYESHAGEWVRPMNKWTHETHIVNMGMMLKAGALAADVIGEKYDGQSARLWNILYKYNGTAVGTFTGDECLSGISNAQGTELCSVVELMYSCEELFRTTGDAVWLDRLERAAFNALPATLSDDMWTHQYDQQVNQIACVRFPGRSMFRTNGPESHLFGLEPNYGCCTANFNQGWPKLAMNTFLRTPKGLAVATPLPSSLETEIGGKRVSARISGEYPFKNRFAVTIESDGAEFELRIRVPGWAKAVLVNGEKVSAGRFIMLRRVWTGSVTTDVELCGEPHLVSRPHGLKVLEYGALVYALPIETEYKKLEYERDGVERRFPYCDYELYPRSKWSRAFADEKFEPEDCVVSDVPFSSEQPPAKLRAQLCDIDWGYADGFDTVSAPVPHSTKPLSAPETAELAPYGCAKLRMTEMPVARR